MASASGCGKGSVLVAGGMTETIGAVYLVDAVKHHPRHMTWMPADLSL